MDDRAADGVAHLQAATRELIAAARSFLDVAEELVDDPEAVTSVVGGLIDLVRGASGATGRDGPPSSSGSRSEGVERIVVE